jgi:serine/threonine protein kinase
VGFLDTLKRMFAGKGRSNLPRINVQKRFELIGRTGQGSMSKVWRARDRNLGRTVCLKILDKDKTRKFEARFGALKRPLEGAISTALKHKNTVQIFEYGYTSDDEQYIVMELIEGVGLNFMVENNKDLAGRRVDILLQLTDAVEHCHKSGYLHRDICCRNVMVTGDGKVKLIDYGLAIPYRPEFCRPGNRTGTHPAPELIKRTTTDHRVDLFALGVAAYEVFTGALPWEKSESMQRMMSYMNNPGRDPRDFRPDLDEKTAKFLVKAIERNPQDRYQSAADFREALKGLPEQ